MRILLQTTKPVTSNTNNYIKNTVIHSDSNASILLLPLPDFVDSKCSCGKTAIGMTEEFEFLCSYCFDERLGISNYSYRNEYKTPNVEDFFKKQQLQWSLEGKGNWYRINGRNVISDSKRIIKSEELERLFHEFAIKILSGNTESIEAEYNKDKRELKVLF